MPVTDLLIHISAPATRKADDCYRAMALAYASYNPHQTHPLVGNNDQHDLVERRIQPQDADTNSYQGLFAHLPGLDVKVSLVAGEAEGQHASPDGLQNNKSGEDARPNVYTSRTLCIHDQIQTLPQIDYVEDTPRAILALESQLLTSSLRALGAEDEEGNLEEAVVVEDDNGGTQEQKSPLPLTTVERKGLIPDIVHIFAEDKHQGHEGPRKRARLSPSSPTEVQDKMAHEEQTTHTNPTKTTDPYPHPLQITKKILPPPPIPSSISDPPNPITPLLSTLLATPSLASRYTPLFQTRPLRPLERGYWYIPSNGISSWDAMLYNEFWECVQENIGSGGAGWGVWCVCAAAQVGGDEVGVGVGVGDLRFYTFGGAAEAVWLLLFVASRSKVRRMEGVVWVDAGGVSVVVMS